MDTGNDPHFDPSWGAFKDFFTELHVPPKTILLRECEVARQAYTTDPPAGQKWSGDGTGCKVLR